MIDLSKLNTGRDHAICHIHKIEKKYNASWVGQLPLKTKDGSWSVDNCGDVYYQENPPNGYSNYFALIMQYGTLYITSGLSGVEGIINGIIADNGEIIYSRYRHDYRESEDGSVFIDGGRDYVKFSSSNKLVQLKIIDGKFYECKN